MSTDSLTERPALRALAGADDRVILTFLSLPTAGEPVEYAVRALCGSAATRARSELVSLTPVSGGTSLAMRILGSWCYGSGVVRFSRPGPTRVKANVFLKNPWANPVLQGEIELTVLPPRSEGGSGDPEVEAREGGGVHLRLLDFPAAGARTRWAVRAKVGNFNQGASGTIESSIPLSGDVRFGLVNPPGLDWAHRQGHVVFARPGRARVVLRVTVRTGTGSIVHLKEEQDIDVLRADPGDDRDETAREAGSGETTSSAPGGPDAGSMDSAPERSLESPGDEGAKAAGGGDGAGEEADRLAPEGNGASPAPPEPFRVPELRPEGFAGDGDWQVSFKLMGFPRAGAPIAWAVRGALGNMVEDVRCQISAAPRLGGQTRSIMAEKPFGEWYGGAETVFPAAGPTEVLASIALSQYGNPLILSRRFPLTVLPRRGEGPPPAQAPVHGEVEAELPPEGRPGEDRGSLAEEAAARGGSNSLSEGSRHLQVRYHSKYGNPATFRVEPLYETGHVGEKVVILDYQGDPNLPVRQLVLRGDGERTLEVPYQLVSGMLWGLVEFHWVSGSARRVTLRW